MCHVTNCKFSRYHNPFDRVRAAIHSGDINTDGATLEIVFLVSLLICDDFIWNDSQRRIRMSIITKNPISHDTSRELIPLM